MPQRMAASRQPSDDYADVVRGAVAMGFAEADAVRAVSAGRHNVDAVVNWILDAESPAGGGAAPAEENWLPSSRPPPSNPFSTGFL